MRFRALAASAVTLSLLAPVLGANPASAADAVPSAGLLVKDASGTVVPLQGAVIAPTATAFHPYQGTDVKAARFWLDVSRETASSAVGTPTHADSTARFDLPLTNLAEGNHRVTIEVVLRDGNRMICESDFVVTRPETPQPVPQPAGDRLGLHVSTDELSLWRQRAATGPYKTTGDAIKNSPGDWAGIVSMKDRFLASPARYAWMGPTHNYPSPVLSSADWPRQDLAGVPGQDDGAGAAEPIRDAAFYAMVAGATQAPGATLSAAERDRILGQVKASIQASVRSKYLDFSNTQRWNPGDFGSSYHPSYQISRWITITAFAYDYAQVANPGLWAPAEKAEFVTWMNDAAKWYTPKIDRRRNGMFNADGTPSAEADQPYGEAIWSGGPRSEKIHSRLDNHVPRLVQVPVFAGLLAQLEQQRSGVTTLSQARIDQLVDYGRRTVSDYLVAEFIPQAEGAGGGVRSASGNFYRWGDPPPINGWKYAMSHLGRTLMLADHIARSGEVSIYEQSTTVGTSLTAGTLPNDGITNGGPKTLRGALRQMLSYIDENAGPSRYGCANCATEAYRIDSRDDINKLYRTNDWEVLHANVYLQDDYVKSVYMRSRPGTPDLPADPKSGQGDITGGPDGAYPGANFMFAQTEGKVWPYPGNR